MMVSLLGWLWWLSPMLLGLLPTKFCLILVMDTRRILFGCSSPSLLWYASLAITMGSEAPLQKQAFLLVGGWGRLYKTVIWASKAFRSPPHRWRMFSLLKLHVVLCNNTPLATNDLNCAPVFLKVWIDISCCLLARESPALWWASIINMRGFSALVFTCATRLLFSLMGGVGYLCR